jgi:hypothetical protein
MFEKISERSIPKHLPTIKARNGNILTEESFLK